MGGNALAIPVFKRLKKTAQWPNGTSRPSRKRCHTYSRAYMNTYLHTRTPFSPNTVCPTRDLALALPGSVKPKARAEACQALLPRRTEARNTSAFRRCRPVSYQLFWKYSSCITAAPHFVKLLSLCCNSRSFLGIGYRQSVTFGPKS